MRKAIEYAYRKAARVGSVVALAAIVVAGASAPAAAQSRQFFQNRDQYRDWNDYHRNRRLTVNDIRRIANVNGYNEGYEAGIEARRSRRSSTYFRYRQEYRDALSGFINEWGDRRVYQVAFRDGFQRGFADGYYSRNRSRDYDRVTVWRQYQLPNIGYYGNPSGYYNYNRGPISTSEFAQHATQRGYYDGFYRGQYDRSRGVRRPNPQGHGAYSFALNGWEEDWGNSSTYQRIYRQYFLEGYQDGYGNRAFRENYRPRR